MLYGAKSLISLDLSNLVLISINNTKKMFYDCISLKYLNLKSFYDKQNLDVDVIFSHNLKNLIYYIDEEVSSKIKKLLNH